MKDIEQKLLEILEEAGTPLNSLQICRLYNGAKSKYDIKFCRNKPTKYGPDPNRFKSHGNAPYANCHKCKDKWTRMFYYLWKLVRKDVLETRLEWRTDPIVRRGKDRMRMWAFKGKLPSLDHFSEFQGLATTARSEK